MKSNGKMITGNKNFLIGLDQIDGGRELGLTLQEIIELYGSINPNAYRLKSVPIEEKDLSRELQDKINNFEPYDDKELRNKIANLETYKANKMDLHDYRRLDTEIHERDLSTEVQRKLNTVSNGYDDTEVKTAISTLQSIKADKVQLENYRPKDILITMDDLDPEMLSFLENFDKLDEEIDQLRRTKADRTELIDYRHKLVAISKADLDAELINILNSIPEDANHDDILLAIESLRLNKADKVEMDKKATLEYVNETFRKLQVKIGLDDLDEYLRAILDDLPSNFDLGAFIDYVNQQITRLDAEKLSVEASKVFRVKTDFIAESDLDNLLRDKINAVGDGYDDAELREAINELESRKLDSSAAAANYRKLNIAISETDLTPELQIKVNKDYDIEELRGRVTNVENNLDVKLEQKDLENYRTKDILIQEDDLSSAVREKLNIVSQGYDDTAIWAKTVELEEEDARLQSEIDKTNTLKADKTEMNKYRLKETEIVESDLETSLQEKINKNADIDLTPLETEIANLKTETERLENEKVDNQTLSNYRSKLETIKKHDLDTTVIDFINGQSYDDSEIVKEVAKKIDKTEVESTYRKKNVSIVKADLELPLQTKIDSITNDHTKMVNHNADARYVHITLEEYNKFLGYEAQLVGILDRLAKLEDGKIVPSIVSSSIDNMEKVPVNITTITFEVSPTDSILEDPSRIQMTPVDKIVNKTYSNGTLTLTLSNLDYDTNYTINVLSGTLCYRDLPNMHNYSKPFRTEESPVDLSPIVGHSILNGNQEVPVTTSQILFPIDGEGVMTVKDKARIVMSPNRILGVPTIVGNNLKVSLLNLTETTDYTLTIQAGAIESSTGFQNKNVIVDTFKTEDVLTRPIISDSVLKDATDVLVTTNKIEFPVICGEEIVIADQSKIKVEPNVKKGNARVESNKLVMDFNTPLDYSTMYTVSIEEGALRDGDDLTNDVTITNSFITEESPGPIGEVLWEYEVSLDGINNRTITYAEIAQSCGLESLDDIQFYANSLEDLDNGIIEAEPPCVVEYWGTSSYPQEKGMRVPREGIDDGGECPLIPVPEFVPAGVNLYTMGAYTPDADRIVFNSGPVFAHTFRVRKYRR